jgi:hypothetical protein
MGNPQTTLPPVPKEPIIDSRGGMSMQWTRWIQQLQRVLSFSGGIAWSIVDKAGSKLTDIEDRSHSMLQDVLAWVTGTDTAKVRHISNADGKAWQDHIEVTNGNPHGTDHSQLDAIGVLVPGTDTTQDKHLSNAQAKVWQDHVTNDAQDDHSQYLLLTGRPDQIATTPLILGTLTDNTTIEANGFAVANGAARAYEDIQFNMTPKATGAGHPTIATWNTDFEEYSFAIGDHANGASQETPHWWAEGTTLSFHIHWSTGSGNYVNGDKVQWQLHVSAANSAVSQPFTAFPAATVLTGETAFTTTVNPFSHVLTAFSAYTLPASLTKIGAQIKVRIERIAKTAGGTDPGTPPFVLQVGCHALADTNGSRSIGSK